MVGQVRFWILNFIWSYDSWLVMEIGHIFKIDDRYTNINRWSIINDNLLLNVYVYKQNML